MSTGNKIGVLLEAGSVGSSCSAASSSGCVEIVSLPSIPLLYSILFLLATNFEEKRKRKGIWLESRETVAFRDLAGNRLTTLHRDTFLDMTRLNHLWVKEKKESQKEVILRFRSARENSLMIVRFRDLSDNSIEHLPLNLFFSLHAVTRIRLSKNLLGEMHRSQFFNTRNLRILWVIVKSILPSFD